MRVCLAFLFAFVLGYMIVAMFTRLLGEPGDLTPGRIGVLFIGVMFFIAGVMLAALEKSS
jgi:hypothetical protein